MRTDCIRMATLLSASSLFCLSALSARSANAQIAPTPAPSKAHRSVARAPQPALTLDGPEWMALEDARNAADDVRGMTMDLDFQPLTRLSLDVAPMIAAFSDISPDASGYAKAFGRSDQETPRAAWARSDPADSLYRLARESLNSGDYRRAAQLFAQITRQFPTSEYRADAMYWQAFALYRIGDVADLHDALHVLDSAGTSTNVRTTPSPSASTTISVSTAPRASTNAEGGSYYARAARAAGSSASVYFTRSPRNSDNESAILAMRIRSALAARGDAAAAAQIASAAGAAGTSCDEEDAALRIEALNALVQMDPKNAEPAITKVLARRDSCSVPLRQGAIALAARNTDAHTTSLLISTAHSDPSIEVQAEALRGLSRIPDASATSALSEIVTSSKNAALQRIAVRSLAVQNTAIARQALRSLMTRPDLPNDVRITALHYAGKDDLQISDLTKIYDASADRSTRAEIISLLQQRSEPAASDELANIARTSTDPALTRRAIDALTSKKDPRTTKLLMDILNR